MSQIRLTKTAEITEIMDYLKKKWFAMDEIEIVKMAISKFYQEEISNDQLVELLSEEDSKGLEISRQQIKQGLATKYNSQSFLQSVMQD